MCVCVCVCVCMTNVDFRGAADNILHSPPMNGKVMHQHPGVEVPELDCEVRAPRHQVDLVIGLAVCVGVEQRGHTTLVTFEDAVLGPT